MSNNMTGREVLRAIADGASMDDIEYTYPGRGRWEPLSLGGVWGVDHVLEERQGVKFRRKPCTINIRGFDVPAPEPADRLIPNGMPYFIPECGIEDWRHTYLWSNDSTDNLMLKRGLVYLNQDDAVRVAKAMCGINPDTKE